MASRRNTIDLTQRPIEGLPGQRPGETMTIADVHRLCEADSWWPWANTQRTLSKQEKAALIKLAYYTARQRGSDTIGLLSLDEMLEQSDLVCPFTLKHGPQMRHAQLIENCNGECPPVEIFAQFMGWLPWDMWARQREKQRLWNLVPIGKRMRALTNGIGAIVPTTRQLAKLIVELESRLAQAIGSAGPSWTLSTEFGASTALTSIEVGATGNAKKRPRGKTASALYAHEYQWLVYYACISLKVYDDNAVGKERHVEHVGPGWPDGLNEFEPPLPTFASFISPSAAVANYVLDVHTSQLNNFRYKSQKDHLALCVYFCKLCSITSGKGFADVLATRPTTDLPELLKDVKRCLHVHGKDESHRRAFPSFDSAVGKRKRSRGEETSAAGSSGLRAAEDLSIFEVDRVSRPPGSAPGDDVWFSWRVVRQGSRAEAECHEQCLKSAIWRFQTLTQQHRRLLIDAFDNGRGFNLYDLLTDDWSRVWQGVGPEKAEALKKLRKQARESHYEVWEWLKKIMNYPPRY